MSAHATDQAAPAILAEVNPAVIPRRVLVEPPQPELERRMWLTERVDVRALLVDLLACTHHGERREHVGIDRVNTRRDRTGLRGQSRTRRGEFVVPQYSARASSRFRRSFFTT